MSAIEGLKAYKARQKEQEDRRAEAARGRYPTFALKRDGDSAIIRFAQEIDLDATHYNAERGIGFVNLEHNHPDPKQGWRNRANCSIDSQGACYPCERVGDQSVAWADRKGWKQKEQFYINIIAGSKEVEVEVNNKKYKNTVAADIDRKTGDGTVFLLKQGTYNGIWDALVAYALAQIDEENDDFESTITDKYFQISRKGSEFNDTSYILTPLKEIPASAKSLDEFELINIKEDVLKEVPYGQQEAFYHAGLAGAPDSAVADNANAGSDDSTTTTKSDEPAEGAGAW